MGVCGAGSKGELRKIAKRRARAGDIGAPHTRAAKFNQRFLTVNQSPRPGRSGARRVKRDVQIKSVVTPAILSRVPRLRVPAIGQALDLACPSYC